MKAMQSLVKIPEIQATMRELSKEMMKVIGLVVLSLQTTERSSELELELRLGLGLRGCDWGECGCAHSVLRRGADVIWLKPLLCKA